MKIYLTPPQHSLGLERIRTALTRYKPEWVEVVERPGGADLLVLYAIGRHDAILKLTQAITKSKFQKYAVIQACLRSTMTPNSYDWMEIWDGAEVVWSYYDLDAAINADAQALDGFDGYHHLDNFYHAPLGADAEVFQIHPYWDVRDYVVISSGQSRLSESVRECHLAAQAIGRKSAHLGELQLENVDCYSDVPDNILRGLYNTCEFVSGLRRKEGFELPAVEGLLCGARPILFNSRDYRHWYEPWGHFIEEGTRQQVVDQLVEIFKQGARPVTHEERAAAVDRFNWKTIVEGFYKRIL